MSLRFRCMESSYSGEPKPAGMYILSSMWLHHAMSARIQEKISRSEEDIEGMSHQAGHAHNGSVLAHDTCSITHRMRKMGGHG